MKDDKIVIIKNDLKKIAARPTQYISSLGEMGVFHLCKEIIDNNRDECYKKESPGNNIEILITDKEITTRDNGRGIPTNILQEVYETIQAGSNMTRSSGTTAGENGVGSTCVLAMSSYFEVTTIRPIEKKKLTLKYKNAELIERNLEEYDGKDHGLILTFRPNKKILGVDTIPVGLLGDWLHDFDYTLPRNIKMDYKINGKQFSVKHKELETYFDMTIAKTQRLCPTLTFECEGELKETFMDKTYDRHFKIETSIMYSSPEYRGELIQHSWMNMIHTPQNGSHVSGVVSGFSKYITERIINKNKRYANEDLMKDIRSHFNIVVRAECDLAHMFSSQAKHTVSSKALNLVIADSVYNKLSSMSQRVIDDMIYVVIANHRARIEGEKARDISRSTKEKNSWVKPDSFLPCSPVKTEHPKEIFLVEGNSAGGGLRAARNAMYQAILMFRGKSLNVWDEDIDRVLKSTPWLNLVKILGCGIGPTFDIKKLRYDKIIIATDADIDGYHIRVGFISFFLKYMPEIIKAGKLYVAEPPLYQIAKGKDVSYVASQTEYIQRCIDSIGDLEISFVK